MATGMKARERFPNEMFCMDSFTFTPDNRQENHIDYFKSINTMVKKNLVLFTNVRSIINFYKLKNYISSNI